MDLFDIREKSVVITGGGVLCKSVARELALRGANVALPENALFASFSFDKSEP